MVVFVLKITPIFGEFSGPHLLRQERKLCQNSSSKRELLMSKIQIIRAYRLSQPTPIGT